MLKVKKLGTLKKKTVPKKYSQLKRGLTEKEITILDNKYDKQTLKTLASKRYTPSEKTYNTMTKRQLLNTLRNPQTTKVKTITAADKIDSVKSFTPSIEQYLQKVQPLSPLGEISDQTYYSDKSNGIICRNPHSSGKYKNFLYFQIPNSKECVLFTEPTIQQFYLKNLKKSLTIQRPTLIIAPKQYQSNCWFNCMFMVFFVSNKGRKFFKYFRRLMIQGKRIHQQGINTKELTYRLPTKLHSALFMLNMLIHKSLSGVMNESDDTNIIIKEIFNALPDYKKKTKIANIGESSNALTFYTTLFRYLNDKFLKLQEIILSNRFGKNTFTSDQEFISSISNDVIDKLSDEHIKYSGVYKDEESAKKQNTRKPRTTVAKFPDIIVVEIFDNDSLEKLVNPQEFTIKTSQPYKMSANYKLDSAIIRDINQNHFACVVTINNSEYGFDGESYKRLNRFSWKRLLTKNKGWTFRGSNTRWNFRRGYQQLFYYRTK